MSNRQKLKKHKLRDGPPQPFEDLEAREWHAVQALAAAGQKTVQCRYCEGPNPIKLETLLDGDTSVDGIVWRICEDHGLEVVCGGCVIERTPQMHRPSEDDPALAGGFSDGLGWELFPDEDDL